MKRKLSIIFCILISVIVSASSFAACEGAVRHTLTLVSGIDATCTKDGSKAYYVCSGCGDWFEDERGERKIYNHSSVIIGKGHKLTHIEAQPSTCTADGHRAYYACDVCNKWFYDLGAKSEIASKSDVVIAKSHSLRGVSQKSATCTADGNIAYYVCGGCDKWFYDSEGKSEIFNKSDVVLEKGHKLTSVKGKEASCSAEGRTAYFACSVCDKWFKDGEGREEITDKSSVIIGMTEHSIISVAARESTCAVRGYSAHYTCRICDKLFEDKDGKTEITDKSGIWLTKPPHNYDNNVCTECGIHTPTEGLLYRDKGDYYEVYDLGTATDSDIYIAEEYDGKPVTSIGEDAFSWYRSITSVTIPDSITNIGDSAFFGCQNLTSVTLFEGVKIIDSRAFTNCSSLTSITIPDSVTYIGDSAFENCSGLTSVKLGKGLKSIGDSAFEECRSIESITIPDSVTSIGERAFVACIGLTSVTIPDSVTTVGKAAFYWCRRLEKAVIGEGLTAISYEMFDYCEKLESVTIPASVKSIDAYAFEDCTRLKDIYFDGTKAQWNAIDKGFAWNADIVNCTVHCTDGDIIVSGE